MVIIETRIFTAIITSLLADEEYAKLQTELMENPGRGTLIQGSKGLRKYRFGAKGRGKRGGVRIIYYWLTPADRILMLFAYPKNKQNDLTKEQQKQLVRITKAFIDEEKGF